MATPQVNCDTFICGSCQKYFSDLVNFLEHKRSTSCGVKITYASDHNQETEAILLSENPSAELTEVNTSAATVKRRGRPKKGQIDDSTKSSTDIQSIPPAPKTASIGEDGTFTCNSCKVNFKRERHFKSHKCSTTDAIFLKPEDIPELEEGFDSRIRFPVIEPVVPDAVQNPSNINAYAHMEIEEINDDDDTEDYRPDNEEEVEDQFDDDSMPHEDEDYDFKVKKSSKRKHLVATDAKKKLQALSSRRIIADYAIPQTLDDIPDIPVFPTEEARIEFEKKEITVVDLSQTDSMYKVHVLEQTMNANAYPLAPRSQADISLYSCNTCEKVFKSLSHIRYHCLTHIDAKPFKCPEIDCGFRSNSKGNIYSHMRKHTGQMYRCRTCDFKSVNKTHLLEHEATHSNVIHKCALCLKHYSSIKSLVNHVRKFHSDDDQGKEYLAQFIGIKEGPGAALLYNCHICDRKFKKQSDRDRHLYVHNVRVEHTLYTCELCQYETSKISNLDAHFIKHKFAYGCQYCDRRFRSVLVLLDHLRAEHEDQEAAIDLPPACFQKSLYLAEDRQNVLTGATCLLNEEPSNTSLYERLGYLPLTQLVYEQLRQKFGFHECRECGNWFHTSELCEQHSKSHEGERPFTCHFCGHSTYSRNSLKLHINAHHEDQLFKCDMCEFVSKGKVALLEHKQRHEHMECPLCKQFTPGRKALRNHLLSKHSEVDAEMARRMSGYGRRTDTMKGISLKCPYCEKTFANSNSELQKHLWTHEGIKPYKCELCDYTCRTRSNLSSHMLRHVEYKPFPCSICGKKYKSKTALRWHERSHSNGKEFKCDRCNYEATQKSHLMRHMETHNIVKRYTCNHCYFSANTLGYMRIHYTRFHPGLNYSSDANAASQSLAISSATNQPTSVYKCVSCDYLFGNLSDMKRHLRMRHRIHMADMRQPSGPDTITSIVPMENQDGITSGVQILMDEDGSVDGFIPGIVNSDSSVMVGDTTDINAAGIQLIEFASQGIATENERQVVIHYPSTSGEVPEG